MNTQYLLQLPILLLAGSIHSNAQQKPNIVFILADDCTKWDLGCYGSKDSKTPTIDKLANQGIKFSKCYQHAPMCSPTRHSIYTGLYPVQSGAYPNHTFAKKGVNSAAQYLKPLGYRVALSGKQHIAPKAIFDFEYLENKSEFNKTLKFKKTDAFLADAKLNEQNFCLFFCSNEPHSPWTKGDTTLFDLEKITLPPNIANTPLTRESFRNYLAEINYLDSQVKRILDLLEKHKLQDNTIVIFASEQGNSFPFAKWTCYNAGLSSALIAYWPGVIKPGSVSDALVEYVDLLPTFIDVAGGKRENNLDGKSLTTLFKNPQEKHKKYTYGLQTTRGIHNGSEYFPIRTISDGEYRLILNLAPEMQFSNVVTHKDKYFKEWISSQNEADKTLTNNYLYRPAIELYNDITDPYNQINLANNNQHKAIINELQSELFNWMAHCGDKGLETELQALQHTGRYINSESKCRVVMEHQKALSKGNLKVKKKGYYTFYTQNNLRILVDDQLLISPATENNNTEKHGVIGLNPGYHKIKVENNTKTETKIFWSGPDFKKTLFTGFKNL